MIPLVLAKIKTNSTERAGSRLDPVGLLLATGGALGIVWALIRANSLGWSSPEIVVTLTAGIILAALSVPVPSDQQKIEIRS